MSEFMECGLHFIYCKESGNISCRRCEIAYVIYDRSAFFAIFEDSAALKLFHPCSLTLGCAGEVVAHPHGDVFAGLCIDNIVYCHILDIFGSVRHRYHLYAPELFSAFEHTFENIVK